jgi:hypothetical protein
MTGLMIRVMMVFSQRWGVFAGSGACDTQAQGQLHGFNNGRGITIAVLHVGATTRIAVLHVGATTRSFSASPDRCLGNLDLFGSGDGLGDGGVAVEPCRPGS